MTHQDDDRNADGTFKPRTPEIQEDHAEAPQAAPATQEDHVETAAKAAPATPDTGRDVPDDQRLSRDQTVRDAEHFYDDDAFDESWLQRMNLEAPTSREGFVQRWVATRVMGEDSPVNSTRQHRNGWRPRDPSTVPLGFFPAVTNDDGTGYIGYAGLVLMERPEYIHLKHRKIHRDEVARRTRQIDNDLRRDESPGQPFMITRRTQVQTRRPEVQQDAE